MGLLGKLFGQNDDVIKPPIQGADITRDNQGPVPLDKSQPGVMTIEDTFSISGRGAVAVGQVDSGFFYIGQKATVVANDGEYIVTIKSVEAFRKMMDYAGPGDKVGLLIDGIDRDTLEKGYEIRGLPENEQ